MGGPEGGSGEVAALALAWLAVYVLHSSCVLGGTWLLLRWQKRRAWNLEDAFWRWGLLVPLVSASLHLGLRHGPEPARLPVEETPVTRVFTIADVPEEAPLSAVPAAGAISLPATQARPLATLPTLTPLSRQPRVGSAPAPTAPPRSPRQAQDPAGSWRLDWTLSILGLWGLAACVLLIRFLRARMRLRETVGPRQPVCDPRLSGLLRELSRGTRLWGHVQLTCSENVPTPVCLGPREICIPARALQGIAADQQEAMLAHEFSHLLRRDPVWLFLHGLLANLLFFQPLNRIARSRYQAAAEYLCDAWAARATGGGLSLAASLAEVAGWLQRAPSPPAAMAGMAQEGSQLVARIQQLLENGGRGLRRPPLLMRLAVPLAILGGGLALPGPGGEAFRDRQHALGTLPAPAAREGVRIGLLALSHDLVLSRSSDGTFGAALDGRPLGSVSAPPPGGPWLFGEGQTTFHLARDTDGCLLWDLASLRLTAGFDPQRESYAKTGDEKLSVSCSQAGGSVHLRISGGGAGAVAIQQSGTGIRCAGGPGSITLFSGNEPVLRIRLTRAAQRQDREAHVPELLGLTVATLGEALAAQIGCAPEAASLVTAAPQGLPAARAGLRRFDVITHLDGRESAGPRALAASLRARGGAGRLYLRILRAGRPRELSLALGSSSVGGRWSGRLAQLRELERRQGALEEADAPREDSAEQEALERMVERARQERTRAVRAAVRAIGERSRARIEKARIANVEALHLGLHALRVGLPGRLRAAVGAGVPEARLEALVQHPLAQELQAIENRFARSLTWIADERSHRLEEEVEKRSARNADADELKRWDRRQLAADAKLASALASHVTRCVKSVKGALRAACERHAAQNHPSGSGAPSGPAALEEARLTQLGLTLGILELEEP